MPLVNTFLGETKVDLKAHEMFEIHQETMRHDGDDWKEKTGSRRRRRDVRSILQNDRQRQ